MPFAGKERGAPRAARRRPADRTGRTTMSVTLKPLDEQVMVITGASSGIGLATALAAAKEGARLVLAARSADTLADVESRIIDAGGEAIHVAADVGRRDDVERIAEAALERFGGFDTWVNDA